MVLIDRVLKVENLHVLAEVTITANSLFQDENKNVPAWIGIEYMAQTIAAFAGVIHSQKNEPIKYGFLVGTRTYEAFVDYFTQGKTYLVEATQLFIDSGLASFECRIKEKETERECCYAKINVFEPENTNNL